MKCLNAQIALRPKLMREQATEGSTIILAQEVRERSQEAEVVEVGPGEMSYGKRIPIDLAKGDRVLYLRQGYTATINGETLYFVTDRDILAVLYDDDSAEFYGQTVDEEVRKAALGRE